MKQVRLMLVLGAVCLALLLASCGGSSSGLSGISSLGGGASKAPINGGKVYVNGSYITTTSANGNFTLPALGYAASDYPLTVEIKGGRTAFQTYADDQVVLDGYLYAGDSTIYLSAFSMIKKRWIDAGLTAEEAQGRLSSMFATIGALVGYDFGSVGVGDNPTASTAYEVAQQALLSLLGVDESSAANIGEALGAAIEGNLTDSIDASAFNTDMGNLVTAVIANRATILAAASTAKGLGTALSVNTSAITSAAVGLNVWHTSDDTSYSQAGTVWIDAGTATTVKFALTRTSSGAASGGGVLKVDTAGNFTANSSDAVRVSHVPVILGSTLTKAGSAFAYTDSFNNSYLQLAFNPASLTEAQKRGLLDDVYTVRFYAANNASLSQTFKIRFTYAAVMGKVTDLDLGSFGTGLTASSYNFGTSTKPLYIDQNDRIDLGTGAALQADVNYSGADNLDGVFLRFVAPAGFKFNRAGWSTFYSNIDVYDLTSGANGVTIDTGANTATVLGSSTQVLGTGNFYLVATPSAQAVGKKSFTVKAMEKTGSSVQATNSTGKYFVTDNSLSKIAQIDMTSYNGQTDLSYSNKAAWDADGDMDPLLVFVGTVKTWGKLSTIDSDCSTLATATVSTANDNWSLSTWSFNRDSGAGTGFTYNDTTWAKNLDLVDGGSSIESSTVSLASDCTLTITPGSTARYKSYFLGNDNYNVDKISVVYKYDESASDTNDFSITSDTLDFYQE